MEFIEKLINLCAENIETDSSVVKLLELVYRHNGVAQITKDPQKYNVLISEMITNSKRFNVPLPEVENRIQMNIQNFSDEDFNGPKPTPQPVPPVDFEVKTATKEADPNEKLIFELGKLTPEAIEKEFTLESYVEKCESLGHKFKKAPKSIDEAFKSFELFYRKTLGI